MTRTILLTLGGLSIGSGIMAAMVGGFGVPGGPASQVFPTLGYDGVADIGLGPYGVICLVLGAAGVAMMVAANATAWKDTNGY